MGGRGRRCLEKPTAEHVHSPCMQGHCRDEEEHDGFNPQNDDQFVWHDVGPTARNAVGERSILSLIKSIIKYF
jgi:hypothetical protein